MRNMEPILIRLPLLFVLFCVCLNSGHSSLITVPRDTEVLVNHSTYFNCSTSIRSEQIHWYHYRVGENQTNYVYYKGQFNQIYADRYSIEINNKTGEYNLIIRSVKPGDAGRYVCQDDVGLGNSSSAELIVLGSTPACLSNMKPDGFVGPNSCNLPVETLQLSCSVSYNGNTHPILQWKMEGNDAPILRGIVNDYSGKRATVNLTTSSAIEMGGHFFTCGTTRSHEKQLSCATDAVNIHYEVLAKSDEACNCESYKNAVICIVVLLLIPLSVGVVTLTLMLIYNRRPKRTDFFHEFFPCMKKSQHKKNNDITGSPNMNNPEVSLNNKPPKETIDGSNTKKGDTEDDTEAAAAVGQALLPSIPPGDNTQAFIKVAEITTRASRRWGRAIAGVAALEGQLYVVSAKSSEVEMFDIGTYEFKDRRNLVELENPWDLTSCNLNKCLYIMDLKSPSTPKYVIRVDSNVKTLGQWSTGEIYGNLSVTCKRNVIVTYCDKSKLVIYSPDGTPLNVVSLSVALIYPTHALELRNGQFLICYGRPIDEDNNHRVCILNKKGEFIKNSSKTMETPNYLAVDDAGLVFVADQGNNRVIVLNSDLELIGEVASEQNGLRSPQRICVNGKSTGKLFVVDNGVRLESKKRMGKLLIFTYDLPSQ